MKRLWYETYGTRTYTIIVGYNNRFYLLTYLLACLLNFEH